MPRRGSDDSSSNDGGRRPHKRARRSGDDKDRDVRRRDDRSRRYSTRRSPSSSRSSSSSSVERVRTSEATSSRSGGREKTVHAASRATVTFEPGERRLPQHDVIDSGSSSSTRAPSAMNRIPDPHQLYREMCNDPDGTCEPLPPGWERTAFRGHVLYLDHVLREAHEEHPLVVLEKKYRPKKAIN